MKLTILASTAPLLGFVGAQASGCGPGHIQKGSPQCHCNADGSTTCSSFQICGVGNTNANANLNNDFSATVKCQNKGGNIVEVKTQTITASSSAFNIQSRNGCLTVPQLKTSVPSDQSFTQSATCPNGNWKKILESNTITSTFSYDVTFNGFTCPFVAFSGSC